MSTGTPPESDHYETLGVSPSADSDEVRRAFVSLIRRHGDQAGESDLAVIERARQIRIAHDVLSDPVKRRNYDRSLGLAVAQPPARGASTPPVPHAQEIERAQSGSGAIVETGESPPTAHSEAGVGSGEDRRVDDPTEVADPIRRHGSKRWAAVSVLALAGLVTALVFGSGDEPIDSSMPGSVEDVFADAEQTQLPTGGAEALPEEAVGSRIGEQSEDGDQLPSRSNVAAPESGNPSSWMEQPSGELQTAETPSSHEDVDQTPAAPENDSASGNGASRPNVTPPSPDTVKAGSGASTPGTAGAGTTPARYAAGGLRDSDNPGGQLEGSVAVRFTVDRSGRATDCRAVGGSGDAVLQTKTCQLVEERLRFTPALNSAGQPEPSEIRTTYTWGKRRRR